MNGFMKAFLLSVSTLLSYSSLSYCHEQTVLVLNSENFEHATQASSGMTTGHWYDKFRALQIALQSAPASAEHVHTAMLLNLDLIVVLWLNLQVCVLWKRK